MEQVRKHPSSNASDADASSYESGGTRHRASGRGGHRSRRELYQRIQSLRSQRLTLSLVSVGLVVLSITLGGLARHFWSQRSEARARLAEEQAAFRDKWDRAQKEIGEIRTSLRTAQATIEALVDQRLPGLVELQLDQPVSVDAHSIRAITFTSLRGTGEKGYEFRAVLENDSAVASTPAAIVRLFDALGVQVGARQIGPEIDGEKLSLRPGEIRSYFAVVELDPGARAKYFRIDPQMPP